MQVRSISPTLMRIALLLFFLTACQAQPTPIPPPTRTLAPLPTATPGVILSPTPSLTITPTLSGDSSAVSTAVLPDMAVISTLARESSADVSVPTSIAPPIPTLAAPTVVASTSVALAPDLAINVESGALSPASAEAILRSVPIFSNVDTPMVRNIFALGQANGMRSTVFTTVGDSNTTNGDFLQPIGIRERDYCEWGAYQHLRSTVDYFSTSPVVGASNSFVHESAAARMGFNTAAVLDPFWASSSTCRTGESSLTCEIRRSQPSIAIIMLGGIDVREMDVGAYRVNMEQIVTESIQAGVIPVLTTFIVLPERPQYTQSLAFNLALLDLADQYDIPLINLWAAAESLPDHGIGPDRSHLKARVGAYCDFDGAERELGGTLRNLLTLQMLEALRNLMMGG